MLVHTEIQGFNDAKFPTRMFQYFYRLFDKYPVPIESIVVFTGNQQQITPEQYHYKGIDTQLIFKYKSYRIFQHSERELLKMNNIFALIVLVCRKSLQEGKISDKELRSTRLKLTKTLLSYNYPTERIRDFLLFLKHMLFIKNEEINSIFDQELEKLTGGAINMTVLEILQERERKRIEILGKKAGKELGKVLGRKEGKVLGRKEGKKENAIAIALEMKKEGIPVEQIRKFTKLSLEEIEAIKV